MTNFFSKAIANEVGYGIATDIAATASDLQTDLARLAAVRKAQGLPSFDEQEAKDKAEIRQMMAEGYRFDPDVEGWAQDV